VQSIVAAGLEQTACRDRKSAGGRLSQTGFPSRMAVGRLLAQRGPCDKPNIALAS
jgi:hypothetical protein